jgi:uncharacterized damage-inducible protein DinB
VANHTRITSVQKKKVTGKNNYRQARFRQRNKKLTLIDVPDRMNLTDTCTDLFNQLHELLDQLNDLEFNTPSVALRGATIGQHLRHTLEFFMVLENSVESGVVNYDNRQHSMVLETNRELAGQAIERITAVCQNWFTNRPLWLEVNYAQMDDRAVKVETNLQRELIYNIEHAVHHMAIMRVAIQEVAPHIELPATFGVAASTIRHRAKLIQTSN